MKKKLYISVVVSLLIFSFSMRAQVPADSLPGTYVGEFWGASPCYNPWTITLDTEYVNSYDSVHCLIHTTIALTHGGTYTYYTNYYSCNSTAPTDFYVQFYSGDSMKLINDNEVIQGTQPPNVFQHASTASV